MHKWVTIGLFFVVVLQASLMAAAGPHRSPIEEPDHEGVVAALSMLVDMVGDSHYGLQQPLESPPVLAAEPEPESPTIQPLEAKSLSELVENASARYGIDPLLVHLVMRQESAFNRWALSPTGAMGLMQLMPDTAWTLGVDDPWDPAQNVEGGVRYLSEQLDRFGGDVGLALAAYNAGPGAVQQYGGVPPYPETIHYVDNILSQYRELRGPSETTVRTF